MRLTINISSPEDEKGFYAFLKQYPSVRVESEEDEKGPFYSTPGPPMTREEYRAAIQVALDEIKAGKGVSLEELEKEIKTW
jgi:hypothetical protein